MFEAATRPWQLGAELTPAALEAELLVSMEDYLPHVGLLTALLELSPVDDNIAAVFDGGFDRVRRRIADQLQRGQAAGFIRADLPAWEIAGWITWMAERGMTRLVARSPRTAETRKRLATSLAQLVWHGVYATGFRA